MSVDIRPFLDLKKSSKSNISIRYSKGSKSSLISLSISHVRRIIQKKVRCSALDILGDS